MPFSSILSPIYFNCHSGLDLACPVLDTGESSFLSWIPAGVYPNGNLGTGIPLFGKEGLEEIFKMKCLHNH